MKYIYKIKELFDKFNLSIPNYQRPYEWNEKNIIEFINDIEYACDKKIDNYRLGTIILYKKNESEYEIVDGQQRIITLLLIKKCINPNFKSNLLKENFSDKNTIIHIQKNMKLIKKLLKTNKKIDKYIDKLEVLVVQTEKLDEAFQMFDTQNSCGKELRPHELLKAYHISNCKGNEIENIIDEYNKYEDKYIDSLFSNYLYPIKCWINKNNFKEFKKNDIEWYKGITPEMKNYNFYNIKENHFEIGKMYYCGKEFFDMINDYFKKIKKINKIINDNNSEIYNIISLCLNDEIIFDVKSKYKNNTFNIGTKYVCRLFYCAILYYYDRFNFFDEYIIKKLFIWAGMIRLERTDVTLLTINKYALGLHTDDKISNNIPMFTKIHDSIDHNDLYIIDIYKNEKSNINYRNDSIEYKIKKYIDDNVDSYIFRGEESYE